MDETHIIVPPSKNVFSLQHVFFVLCLILYGTYTASAKPEVEWPAANINAANATCQKFGPYARAYGTEVEKLDLYKKFPQLIEYKIC